MPADEKPTEGSSSGGAEDLAKSVLAVEAFAEKVRAADQPGNDDPSTWREVGRLCNMYARQLAAGSLGLPADILTAARKLVQGIGRAGAGIGDIPAAIARRIYGARISADAAEDQRQAAATERLSSTNAHGYVAGMLLGSTVAQAVAPGAYDRKANEAAARRALAKFQALMDGFRARGLSPGLIEVEPGRFVIVAVQAEHQSLAVAQGIAKLREAAALPAPTIVDATRASPATIPLTALGLPKRVVSLLLTIERPTERLRASASPARRTTGGPLVVPAS